MADESLLWLNDELKSDVTRPFKRCGHVAVRLKRNIIVFGGGCKDTETDHSFKYYSLRLIWSYNLDIDRWIKFVLQDASGIPDARSEACAVAIGSQIYLHGGIQYHDAEVLESYYYGLFRLSTTSTRSLTWTRMNFPTADVPSCRSGHSGWEYQKKLWIFGGYGWSIYEYLHDNGMFQAVENDPDPVGFNNQLCCFSPSTLVWKIVKSSGTVPSPRHRHAIAKVKANIWLYGGENQHTVFDALYVLDMVSLTWTQVQTHGTLSPKQRASHSFIAISNEQIVLYGGPKNNSVWFLDLPSLSWRQRLGPIAELLAEKTGCYMHTGTIGRHSIFILGGTKDTHNMTLCNSNEFVHIDFKPKSLLKSCQDVAYKYRFLLRCKWNILPKNLCAQLRAMCEFSADIADNTGNGDTIANATLCMLRITQVTMTCYQMMI